MKIKDLLIIICVLFSLSAFSQVRTDVLGLKMGQANKAEVIRYFNNHHIKYSYNGNDELVAQNLAFGGHSWFMSFFSFHNEILYSVDFRENTAMQYSVNELNRIFEQLKNQLDYKYGKTCITTTEPYYGAGADPYYFQVNDNTMTIILDFRQDEDGVDMRSLSLRYTYMPLLFEKMDSNYDEL